MRLVYSKVPLNHIMSELPLFTCRLGTNWIGDNGTQALAERLQHWTNLQKLA